ncbi:MULTISPECIES: bacteriohopanetetrol glucosamine biosynthesis glycosyltransferase HpnI [Acetobacter]|uniref:Bacteriohopanetetrol glucosamine biosynthesis glycosyltransferase HpnI n=1 Tax=Acetobacter thailandicus TaxID=1502842 RepID=A0ABT3QGZ1_9PROT|nr:MULTISPECIES: bacteriohopanetetrol glucosamine biosynthesis glycosyltransferase HpnI [Acetobacter]MBS0986261.1 bacteriohopanetetrol glucosamine biosynthesis glycosyltransferase HpnI [Acetobacter thailandicus]MCX2564554.1 bacteriohopanetetrol glucosamine biosynthesis glycosyltransferase HpnI [Acetobacter thailandicus]NHN95981.1 glycosyltransferase [Acetobacter thailandicus]
MFRISSVLALSSSVLAAAGCAQSVAGALLFRRFRKRERSPSAGEQPLPPVTILKPLCGTEPLLEEAIESFCQQDYPRFQILFGVQDKADPAIALVERLKKRYPHLDMQVICHPGIYGLNRKISNLMNVLPYAEYETLIISDSDIHVRPDYLRHIVRALNKAGTGLVTTLYAGRPAQNSFVQRMAASQINHNFLPGVILSRHLGRQDCLGATMALTRSVLESVGGLQALLPHVADDGVLGQLVRQKGHDITIADCLTWTTVAEQSAPELIAHELRWGRTVRSLAPAGYAASSIQLSLFWALLTVLLKPTSRKAWIFFFSCWGIRAITARSINQITGEKAWWPLLFLPLRDLLSAGIMAGSVHGTQVDWRGQTMHVTPHSARKSSNRHISPETKDNVPSDDLTSTPSGRALSTLSGSNFP